MKIVFYITLFFLVTCSKNNGELGRVDIDLENLKKTNLKSKQSKERLKDLFIKIKKSQSNKINRSTLRDICEISYVIEHDSLLYKSSHYLLKVSKENKDTINLGHSLFLLGNYHINQGTNDSALFYFTKAEKILKKINYKKLNEKINLEIAFVFLYEGDFTNCEIYASKCLLTFSENKSTNIRVKYDALNLIGICANELKEFDKSIEYHKKALKIAEKNSTLDNTLIANSKNNIGVVYQNINKHSKSIFYFEDGLKNKDLEKKSPYLFAMLIDNLAYSNLKSNKIKDLPDLFFKSLKIREKYNLVSGIIVNNIHLSEYYMILKDTVRAKKFAYSALELSKSTKVTSDILSSLKQLAIVDQSKSNFYKTEYIKLSEEIQLNERKSKDKFARIAFETDEIIQENDKLNEKNRTLLYVFIAVMVVVSLLFVVRAQRAKTRELLYKQAQQKANEDIYNLMMSQQAVIDESRNLEKKKIARDLHDGVLGRMFGARLSLDSLNNKNDEDSVATRKYIIEELKKIEQDIREISHDLNREKQVLINNFVSIVMNLLEEQQTNHSAKLESDIDNTINWDKIANNIKINSYRILQESLQNINKYANAKTIWVSLQKDENNIVLRIKDDGDGFDVNRKSKGIGMQNMISRTHECNGIIDITSQKGAGTEIKVTIPVGNKNEKIKTT